MLHEPDSQFEMICMFIYCHILIYLFEGSYAIKNIFYFFFFSNLTVLFRDEKTKIYNNIVLPEVHPFVMSVFPTGHVTMISNDFPNMLRGHVFFLCLHKSKLSLFTVSL